MILRKLIFVLLALGVGWLVQRLIHAGTRQSARARRVSNVRSQGAPVPMVRDRMCNTFLPESSALVTTVEGETHFFCSERCRRQFLSGASVSSQPVS